MRHSEALPKSAGCTFYLQWARTYCHRDSASPNTNDGCAASSRSGGSCSCWDSQRTPAGTPHTYFVNKFRGRSRDSTSTNSNQIAVVKKGDYTHNPVVSEMAILRQLLPEQRLAA